MDGTTSTSTPTRTFAAALLALSLGLGGFAAAARADTGGAAAPGGTTPPATTSPAPARSTAPAPTGTGTTAPKRLGDRLPLRKGMRGGDVADLQRLLSRVGTGLTADGDFGPGTFKALTAWEAKSGRPADGVLSPADLTALRRAAAAAPAPSTAPPAPPATATITPAGKAVAPAGAPPAVVAIIAAGNRIAKLPYRYGGGHGDFSDTAYDCSGSVSYALHGAGLLDYPYNSTMLETWGDPGFGTWVSIYANEGHTFMVVAGIRFDTSGQRQAGTRWQPLSTRSYDGFVVRHPTGL